MFGAERVYDCENCLFQILTKDSVTVAVDAVIYFRIYNATMSITNVENAKSSTRLLAQTTLRNVLGTRNLSEILMERDNISHQIQVVYKRSKSFSTCNYCDSHYILKQTLNVFKFVENSNLWNTGTYTTFFKDLKIC